MINYLFWRKLSLRSTLPIKEHDAGSTTGAPLTTADPERPPMFNQHEVFFASLTAAARETRMRRPMTLWQRLLDFADNSPYLRPLLCFLVAVCIVIGLYEIRYLAHPGSTWLLP